MSEKVNKYEMDMCRGPILKKMLIYAIPLNVFKYTPAYV